MFNLIPFSTKEPGLFDYLDALERNFYTSRVPEYSEFRVDIYEKGNDYFLSAELPGFNKEDISIDLKEDILTITAKHPGEKAASDKESTENKADDTAVEVENEIHYIHKERKNCNYKRSFNVKGIDVSGIKANYTNGILELVLPKITPKEPEKIKIDVD